MRWLAPVVIVLVVLGEGVAARHDSATDDEPAHIAAGFLRLHYGLIDFYPEQPPLPGLIANVPLLFMEVTPPAPENLNDHWAVGKQMLYRAGNDADAILFATRCTTIVLFALLLSGVWFFVLRQTQNTWAAFAALAMTAFCPTLLAHARLATSDVAVTAFLYLAVMTFARAENRLWFLAAGLFAGCAIVSKVSGLFVLGFLPLLAIAQKKRVSDCLITFIAALGVIELTYVPLLRVWSLAAPLVEYSHHGRAIFGWLAHPYRAEMFLLGNFSREGWWYYFPVALALKLPIAGLLLGLFALTRRNVASSFVLLFLGISMLTKTDIGVRYVLPLFPFLYTGAAIALHVSSRKVQRVCAVLVAAFVISSVVAYPHDLAFFDELIPPSRADQFLIDSNLDWGQDLKRLDDWVQEHHVTDLRVHYFGGGDPMYSIHAAALAWPAPRNEPLPSGYFAVSRTLYRFSFAPRFPMTYAQYLERSHARYVTTIGRSILLYEVRK